ncbi:MAG: response regulator [Aliarcobacter sp.]|nr:response regulator [Aliarcobacter sp.]
MIPEFLKSQTVLFVEDEELAREILAKILLSKIFKKVITAANGLEGLEKFKESKSSDNEVDLVISDINMPIMNGLDMVENIRELDSLVPVNICNS